MNKRLKFEDTNSLTATHQKELALSEKAYMALSWIIRRQELKSGDALVELQLAEQLGVSRTPLRQALQRLESEGLLLKHANRSYVVRQVEMKEYLQSLRVREMLEPEAAALAVGNVSAEEIAKAREGLIAVRNVRPYDMVAHWGSDDEVHNLFIKNCRNDVLTNMLVGLRATTQLFEIERLAERLDPDSREHERIIEALENSDVKSVKRAVATHIRSLFRFAVKTIG